MAAKLILSDAWSSKAPEASVIESPALRAEAEPSAFEPIPNALILIADDQLDALATIFLQSPLRKAMTFEAYLVIKGYARGVGF